jgi:hypothetical protein
MSLVSATKKAAMVQRKNLAQAAGGQMWAKAAESIGEEVEGLTGYLSEKYNWEENKTAWESFEEGQKYAGVSSEDMLTSGKGGRGKLKEMFYSPEQVHKGKMTAKGREYDATGMTQLGALVSSDQRALYEQMADGKLAESYSKPFQKIEYDPNEGDAGEDGFKPGGYTPPKVEEAKDNDKTHDPTEGDAGEAGFEPGGYTPPSEQSMYERSAGIKLNKKSFESASGAGRKEITSTMNRDWGGGKGADKFILAKQNYYKVLNERQAESGGDSYTQEQGENMWSTLINARNKLQSPSSKPMQ